METLENLIYQSVELSIKCDIIKVDSVFILKRKSVHTELENILQIFDIQKRKLLVELKQHPQDFLYIRIEYNLAKLKTYLGLARVSEFSITKEQWLDWHNHEVKRVFEDMIFILTDI